MDVECSVPIAPLLVENPLILSGSSTPAGANTNPYTPLVPDGWRIRRQDGDDGHVRAFEPVLLHSQGWWRINIAVGSNVGQGGQQFVGNWEIRGPSIIFGTNEQYSRLPMIRQIVSESAYSLTSFLGCVARSGFLALDAIRFNFAKQGFKFNICESGHSAQ